MTEVLKQGDGKQVTPAKTDNKILLNRYLFLRTFDCNYKNEKAKISKDPDLMPDIRVVAVIEELAEENQLLPFVLVKKAMDSQQLPTNEMALMATAYCMRELKNSEELKKEIFKNLAEMLPTSDDLLFFMHCYQLLGNCKMTFPRAMRTFLKKWYSSKTPSELIEILFASHKCKHVGHHNILSQLHLKLDDVEKNEIISAFFKSANELENGTEVSANIKKILKYKQLKRCKEVHEVTSVLKRRDYYYKLEHIPSHALKSSTAVELILPNLSLHEVLNHLLTFCSNKMLKVNEPISKKICNALQASNKAIHEAKLSPFFVFNILKTLEKRLKVIEAKTEGGTIPANGGSADKSKENNEKKFSNPFIITKVQHIFNQALNYRPQSGIRFYVTFSMRKFSHRQSEVRNMREVLPSELQAILSLHLLKSEKEVTLKTFTEERTILKSVEWKSDTSFDKAMETYEKEIESNPKIKENLCLPLLKSAEDKKKVDVFITIVGSIARTNVEGGVPLMVELEKYRKAMNLKMTKYVIINMTRKQTDLKLENSMSGILEINGFHPQAMKIIEAYSRNSFV